MTSRPFWTSVQSKEFPNAHIVTATFDNHRVDVFVPNAVTSLSPLLVMHDGRNVLFPEHSTGGVSWGVLDAIHDVHQSFDNPPIVVSVWIGDSQVPGARYFELAPQNMLEEDPALWGTLLARAEIAPAPLGGNHYHHLIVDEIIPAVQELTGVQPTPERTAICGSSMGGVASLYGSILYPDVYGTVMSLSTHLAFWANEFTERLIEQLPTHPRPRIWIDRGNLDLDEHYIGLHERAVDALMRRGWREGEGLAAHVFEGTGHHERAWSNRIAEILTWWLS